jgi:soluble lytic murein transglycosylase-like protein
MTLKILGSAFALTASLCLGTITPSAAAGGNQPAIEQVTNFNQASAAKIRPSSHANRGKTRSASRKATRKATGAGRGRNPAIVAKVKAHARAAGVPVSTAIAIVHQESGFRPHVTGGAGEIGLMQLKCQTARGMGFSGSCKALYDPDTNLRFGMKYLKAALKRGSIGYYNAGIHAKSLPAAARKYAASVAANRANDG